MEIRNDAQLKIMLGVIAENVIESVSLRVLDYLKENITEYVYKYGGKNKIYHVGSLNAQATYEFYDSFKWREIVRNVRLISKEMFYDWEKMTYDKNTWWHGSDPSKVQEQGGDARKYLASILNAEGTLSSLFMTKPRKPFWDITIKELFNNKKINKMFDEEFKKVGFVKI